MRFWTLENFRILSPFGALAICDGAGFEFTLSSWGLNFSTSKVEKLFATLLPCARIK